MGLDQKCQPGCMSFDGGDVKHRRDCVHYPESLTKLWHDTEAQYAAEISRLRTAIDKALELLDASLFTNAEHSQAKEILRGTKEPPRP